MKAGNHRAVVSACALRLLPCATICATTGVEPVQSGPLLVSVLVCGSDFDLENRAKSALEEPFRFRLGRAKHLYADTPTHSIRRVWFVRIASARQRACRGGDDHGASAARGCPAGHSSAGADGPPHLMYRRRRGHMQLAYDCQPSGLRSGSPSFPPPPLIRPTVRRLLRSPRFMGPGPQRTGMPSGLRRPWPVVPRFG